MQNKEFKSRRLGIENPCVNINLYVNEEVVQLMEIAKNCLTLEVANSKYIPTKAYIIKQALKAVIEKEEKGK